jgi:integrase
MRRGEMAGLRWSDVDLDAKTLSVANNRTAAGNKTVEGEPKSPTSRRTLPLPDRLVSVLRAAKARQAAERLAIGAPYGAGEYVVSNLIGNPYNPQALTAHWRRMVKKAGVRHLKLHGGRHSCATLMHLDGVPVAIIAAWIGHRDASLTMRMYIHSQNGALKAAGETLNETLNDDVSSSCH